MEKHRLETEETGQIAAEVRLRILRNIYPSIRASSLRNELLVSILNEHGILIKPQQKLPSLAQTPHIFFCI